MEAKSCVWMPRTLGYKRSVCAEPKYRLNGNSLILPASKLILPGSITGRFYLPGLTPMGAVWIKTREATAGKERENQHKLCRHFSCATHGDAHPHCTQKPNNS